MLVKTFVRNTIKSCFKCTSMSQMSIFLVKISVIRASSLGYALSKYLFYDVLKGNIKLKKKYVELFTIITLNSKNYFRLIKHS